MNKINPNEVSGDGDELISIYTVLRRLDFIREVRGEGQQQSGKILKANQVFSGKNLFPRKFLFRVLDERLNGLNVLGIELVSALFNRLLHRTKLSNQQKLTQKEVKIEVGCPELDELFHNALHYLYDFIIELDWRDDNDFSNLSRIDSNYVRSRLQNIRNFLDFRNDLANLSLKISGIGEQRHLGEFRASQTGSTVKSPMIHSKVTMKSSLSSPGGQLESIRRRRHVRFSDSPLPKSFTPNSSRSSRSRKQNDLRAILALDMLIYAIDLFLQHLYRTFVSWSSTYSSEIKNKLTYILESKRKFKAQQFNSLLEQINYATAIHLAMLDHSTDVIEIYLGDYVIAILSASDHERLMKRYKIPRIHSFIDKINSDFEKRIIGHLVELNLQIFLDLIISEINLPPFESGSRTKTRSLEEIEGRRGNYLNFINSWLNLDNLLFSRGTIGKHLESVQSKDRVGDKQTRKRVEKTSSIAQFKSSSRILAQMDNLHELVMNCLVIIIARIHSKWQLKYFLRMFHEGFDVTFDLVSAELRSEFVQVQAKTSTKVISVDDYRMIEKNINSIALKTRCLKLVHIMYSLDGLIQEISRRSDVVLEGRISLKEKIDEFSEMCIQRSAIDPRKLGDKLDKQ